MTNQPCKPSRKVPGRAVNATPPKKCLRFQYSVQLATYQKRFGRNGCQKFPPPFCLMGQVPVSPYVTLKARCTCYLMGQVPNVTSCRLIGQIHMLPYGPGPQTYLMSPSMPDPHVTLWARSPMLPYVILYARSTCYLMVLFCYIVIFQKTDRHDAYG